jgi:hypothetical protein
MGRQKLERHPAPQLGVLREVYLAHTAFTELVENPVVGNGGADQFGILPTKGESRIRSG